MGSQLENKSGVYELDKVTISITVTIDGLTTETLGDGSTTYSIVKIEDSKMHIAFHGFQGNSDGTTSSGRHSTLSTDVILSKK